MSGKLDTKTKAELNDCIAKMKAASAAFYVQAIHCNGNHAFIEFTGLMNEYIAVCEDRMREGIDFRTLNKHSGNFTLLPHRLAYLNEKIDCIYGVEFRPKVEEAKRVTLPSFPQPTSRPRRQSHEPGCESLFGDYHCTCQ